MEKWSRTQAMAVVVPSSAMAPFQMHEAMPLVIRRIGYETGEEKKLVWFWFEENLMLNYEWFVRLCENMMFFIIIVFVSYLIFFI